MKAVDDAHQCHLKRQGIDIAAVKGQPAGRCIGRFTGQDPGDKIRWQPARPMGGMPSANAAVDQGHANKKTAEIAGRCKGETDGGGMTKPQRFPHFAN
jgi:hypothetical protein